ncbi:tyrosine-type recombinase/integrase [Rummeliibacillus pycnus]|uniref:tyrosine-type recombinase/integrase n=1 Tax=Rummeliibacillus pycnus TaxID=101070 RepID=UPI0037C6A741
MTVHGLRHSCASLLIAYGVDIKVVQKILGHAHIETTINNYTHVTTETIEKTTDLLINYLKESKKKLWWSKSQNNKKTTLIKGWSECK